ncbi:MULTISPECIES: hypothetical protein [unclassified Tolypothrix]|uniref:hypothetical protein n=1 Tax=unclassified Tolypothrix TaxID=2649714 RepID=UPI0005EAB005|nr:MULTISPECIES: hypothetical protein [unclassified Tolypothrix]EKF04386.1 tRNA (guanine-N(7)-)-methyltransferase [Tolypothrix sp. PCC 7601]
MWNEYQSQPSPQQETTPQSPLASFLTRCGDKLRNHPLTQLHARTARFNRGYLGCG